MLLPTAGLCSHPTIPLPLPLLPQGCPVSRPRALSCALKSRPDIRGLLCHPACSTDSSVGCTHGPPGRLGADKTSSNVLGNVGTHALLPPNPTLTPTKPLLVLTSCPSLTVLGETNQGPVRLHQELFLQTSPVPQLQGHHTRLKHGSLGWQCPSLGFCLFCLFKLCMLPTGF